MIFPLMLIWYCSNWDGEIIKKAVFDPEQSGSYAAGGRTIEKSTISQCEDG